MSRTMSADYNMDILDKLEDKYKEEAKDVITLRLYRGCSIEEEPGMGRWYSNVPMTAQEYKSENEILHKKQAKILELIIQLKAKDYGEFKFSWEAKEEDLQWGMQDLYDPDTNERWYYIPSCCSTLITFSALEA